MGVRAFKRLQAQVISEGLGSVLSAYSIPTYEHPGPPTASVFEKPPHGSLGVIKGPKPSKKLKGKMPTDYNPP